MQETIRARINSDLKRRFESAALARGQSASHLLREFMTSFVEEHEEQERRRKETLLAIESIEAGRFIEGEEVFDWMDSWGTGSEKDVPRCE